MVPYARHRSGDESPQELRVAANDTIFEVWELEFFLWILEIKAENRRRGASFSQFYNSLRICIGAGIARFGDPERGPAAVAAA